MARSRVQFTPPPPAPPAAELAVERGQFQLKAQLVDVGTFNAANTPEVIGAAAFLNQQALGTLGFNIPSLLGVFTKEKFLLHDGSLTLFEQLFAIRLTSEHIRTCKRRVSAGRSSSSSAR